MFSFLDCDVLHVTDSVTLDNKHKLNAFDSAFWNYALAVNFYPDLSNVLNVNRNFSIDFSHYINTVLNGAFNCQNYKRESIAYKEMYCKLTNPKDIPLKLITQDNYRYVLLQFLFESFVINQKYRQLLYTSNEGKACIGYIKPVFDEDIIEDYKHLPVASKSISFEEIASQILDVVKFPKGVYELGNIYNRTIETNQDFSKLLQQVHLSGIIKDALRVSELSTELSESLTNTEYVRLIYNLILFVCTCNKVIVVFDK